MPYPQRRIIQALGLRKLNHSVERVDRPSIRGMVLKVQHLVKVEQVQEDSAGEGAEARVPTAGADALVVAMAVAGAPIPAVV